MTGVMAAEAGSVITVSQNFTDTYQWGIHTYDEQGNYIAEDYGWMSKNSFSIGDGVAYFRINVKRKDGEKMAETDIKVAEGAFSISSGENKQ